MEEQSLHNRERNDCFTICKRKGLKKAVFRDLPRQPVVVQQLSLRLRSCSQNRTVERNEHADLCAGGAKAAHCVWSNDRYGREELVARPMRSSGPWAPPLGGTTSAILTSRYHW